MTIVTSNWALSTPSNISKMPVLVDYSISQITPYVYVTDENTVRQSSQVFSNGINCVINVADELPQITFPSQSGIESLKYPILDTPTFPALHYFDTVVDRMAANVASNRRTLLYCRYGRSRSVTFILAYLIKYHHLPLSTAYALVKSKRQLALPNVGFWSQLKSYEAYQQQQRRQQHVSTFFRNFQDSLIHGQQIFNKISHEFVQWVTHDQFANAFGTMFPTTRTPFFQSYYLSIGRRTPVYSHPYYDQSLPNASYGQYF